MDISTTIFGSHVSCPIGISPTAFHKLGHHDGELASVRAAEKAGVVFTLSTQSNHSIEDIAAAAPSAVKWMQVNIYTDRTITENIVRRAEKCGFKAIVYTIDTPVNPGKVLHVLKKPDIYNRMDLPG